MQIKKILGICAIGIMIMTGCAKTDSTADVKTEETVTQVEEIQATVTEAAVVEPKVEEPAEVEEPVTSAPNQSLTYITHASVKLKTSQGIVIYIDPAYNNKDYSEPADIVLITHTHDDHYKLDNISDKKEYQLVMPTDLHKDGAYSSMDIGDIHIEAVEAYNANHSKKDCVGYLITFDGITVYHAGDTSKTDAMDTFAEKKITYALLPMDGVYNMNPKRAAEVAELIQAKHVIPIHIMKQKVENFVYENKLVMKDGETIILEP